jgi:hypothetical protein
MSETQKIIENLSLHTGVDKIDPAAIERFFLDTINGRSVDPADAMQAAVMLWAIRRGIRAGDDMNVELRQLLKTKKASETKFNFNPDEAATNSPAFGIVMDLVRENIRPANAVRRFHDEYDKLEKIPPDDSTIRRWIKAIEPRAQKTVKKIDALQGAAVSVKKRG